MACYICCNFSSSTAGDGKAQIVVHFPIKRLQQLSGLTFRFRFPPNSQLLIELVVLSINPGYTSCFITIVKCFGPSKTHPFIEKIYYSQTVTGELKVTENTEEHLFYLNYINDKFRSVALGSVLHEFMLLRISSTNRLYGCLVPICLASTLSVKNISKVSHEASDVTTNKNNSNLAMSRLFWGCWMFTHYCTLFFTYLPNSVDYRHNPII